MKKILKFCSVFFKCTGTLSSILMVSIVLLGFEKTPGTYINYVEMPLYAEFLNAKSVKYYINSYGASHYEIEVEKIEYNKNIATTLMFAEKFEVTDNRFIYFDNYYIFSIVIDDDFNAIPSELIKK